MPSQLKELRSCPPPSSGTVYVNDQVSFRTEGTQRVISVHGVVFAHYSVEDRAAEAYAMITLWESDYATQTQVARTFGYSARSLRRYQERFEGEGIRALVRKPGRPADRPSGRAQERGRDQTILHLKAKGASNRAIAGKLGLSEKAIRKRLRRLGWQPQTEPAASGLLFEKDTPDDASPTSEASENTIDIPKGAAAVAAERRVEHTRTSNRRPSAAIPIIQEAAERVAELIAQQKSLPLRVPLAEARPDQDLVKLSTERKHLTNVLKLVAYQIESDLVNLIRPHHARAEDEGRTLIQTVLQSTATLEPTDQELRVTLSPLSSPHRSQAVAALCENLNTAETCFPGTNLRMRFAVAGHPK